MAQDLWSGTDEGRRPLRWLRILMMVGVAVILVYSFAVGGSAPAPATQATAEPTAEAGATAEPDGGVANAAANSASAASVRPTGLGAILAIAGVGLFFAGAALTIGFFIGSLFGIPRTAENAAQAGGEQMRYTPNTNLEQISDWLTKIVVGVTLTQLTEIPGALHRLGEFMAPGLGGAASSAGFGIAVVIYFFVCGFLFSYLWTRLTLAGAFVQADLLTTLSNQSLYDAKAIRIVNLQLEPSTDTPEPKLADLQAAIKAASPGTRLEITEKARQVRKANWSSRDDRNRRRMEATIPVFQTLVDLDKEKDDHIARAQLAFALKDSRAPEFGRARDLLTEAIAIRGKVSETGYLWYEISRAMCNIELDNDFKQGKPSAANQKDAILTDLKASVAELERAQPKVEIIEKWMTINGVAYDNLKA